MMVSTVVITGGIGSGKSVVCSMLAEMGVPVYDSDSRAKELYCVRPDILDRVCDVLGEDVRNGDGVLDRRKLASLIFSDPSRLEAVESVVHPALLDDFLLWKSALSGNFAGWRFACGPFVAFESAIILEKPFFRGFGDTIVLVDAPFDVRLARAYGRDGADRETVLSRMARQKLMNSISSGAVRPEVDYVIINDGDLASLRNSVFSLFRLK